MPFDWRDFLIVAHELRNDPRLGKALKGHALAVRTTTFSILG